MKKKKISEAEKRQRERYSVCLKLNKENDAKVIEQLKKCGNKQGYIKKLILENLI